MIVAPATAVEAPATAAVPPLPTTMAPPVAATVVPIATPPFPASVMPLPIAMKVWSRRTPADVQGMSALWSSGPFLYSSYYDILL